jgi:hypothetical protein
LVMFLPAFFICFSCLPPPNDAPVSRGERQLNLVIE